jgi:hypothetical protein
MLLDFCLAAFSLFRGVCGKVDCVCRARFAGWFCGGAASWVVGASSFRHFIAALFGGLRDGLNIEPIESWPFVCWLVAMSA